MRRLAFCSSLPLAAAASLAQGTPPITIGSPGINPVGFTVGAYGRSVVADLTGHQLPDVVVLATEADGALRETALLIGAPGVHNSAALLRNTAGKKIRDVAVIPGGDGEAGRDALLLATDMGLYRWFANGSTTRFGGTVWNHATRVEVGDTNGDGVVEAIGKMGSASAGNPQNLRSTPIGEGSTWFVNTGAPVLDLAVVDWVTQPGVARDEIAFVHGNAVHFVVDGAIDPALTVTLPLCTTANLVATRAADGTPRLVAGLTDATGASLLATITPGSSLVAFRPVGRPIGGLTVVRHGTAADGVVVAIAENANLVHFAYDPVTFPAEGFDFGTSLRSAATPPNGACDARLLDLDGDGDLDMVAPKLGTGIVVHRTAGPAPGTDGRPILIHLGANDFRFQLPQWATDFETLHYQFHSTWSGTTITGMTLSPLSTSRTISHADTVFQPNVTWPTHGDQALGPVATLVRAVERNGTQVVRRGPFRALIWSENETERSFLTGLLSGALQQIVVHPSQANTPGNLVYGAYGSRDIIVYPNTDTGTEETEQEETELALFASEGRVAFCGAPAASGTRSTPHVAIPGTARGDRVLGIVPGAVEPPDLPPPDGTEPPDGGNPDAGGGGG